jgi:hypothetical protein
MKPLNWVGKRLFDGFIEGAEAPGRVWNGHRGEKNGQ